MSSDPVIDPTAASAVGVTGAYGYVGGVIAEALRTDGKQVAPMVRAPKSGDSLARRFDLAERPAPGLFDRIDALVHCAYDFGPIDRKGIWSANVDATLRLFEAARAAGMKRLIFISSMSAFPGCRSLYGQAKLAVEAQADRLGIIVVRPGLVYGRGAAGMVGALTKLASLPLVMPMVGFGRMVLYLAHEQDLGHFVCRLIDQPPPDARPLIAASPTPMSFRQIVARLSGDKPKLLLPIPPGLLWAGLKAAETVGLRPRTRSDSLISLLNQDPTPNFAPAQAAGAVFRAFDLLARQPGGAESAVMQAGAKLP